MISVFRISGTDAIAYCSCVCADCRDVDKTGYLKVKRKPKERSKLNGFSL